MDHLRLFLNDALRLAREAESSLNRLLGGRQTQDEVLALYRAVHTLKGTASMIPEARTISEALHALEGRLAVGADQSWTNFEWLPEAKAALGLAGLLLADLSRDAAARQVSEKGSAGILALIRREGKEPKTAFFPLNSVIRVLAASEFSGADAVCLDGAWVPVLSSHTHARYGIGVRTQTGRIVVPVDEIIGVGTRDSASTRQLRAA